MIPKIIHYAWFGNPMPNDVKERIEEWKKNLPGWKFIFWNENNFDFTNFSFTKKKVENYEWGYAADELRFDVLNKFGGFYLDTDMIIKRDLAPFLNKKLVMGFMYDNSISTSLIGSEPNNEIIQKILDLYADSNYDNLKMNLTNNPIVTYFLLKNFDNFRLNGKTQNIAPKCMVYSRDYFCYPSKNKNANYAEHLFTNSWNHGRGYSGIKGEVKKVIRNVAPITYGNIANKRGVRYTNELVLKYKNMGYFK